MVFDTTKGKFGPYAGQMIVADVMKNQLFRINMEKVKGQYQGAAMLLYDQPDLGGGSHKMVFRNDKELWVGQTARGWGRGHGLKKLEWTGEAPFELHSVNVAPGGLKLSFTQPVDKAAAGSPGSYSIKSWVYAFTNTYTAPKKNQKDLTVKEAKVSADGKSVELTIDGLAEDTVLDVRCKDLKGADGTAQTYGRAYYTLNKLP
jgi:hypothetical protein